MTSCVGNFWKRGSVQRSGWRSEHGLLWRLGGRHAVPFAGVLVKEGSALLATA